MFLLSWNVNILGEVYAFSNRLTIFGDDSSSGDHECLYNKLWQWLIMGGHPEMSPEHEWRQPPLLLFFFFLSRVDISVFQTKMSVR